MQNPCHTGKVGLFKPEEIYGESTINKELIEIKCVSLYHVHNVQICGLCIKCMEYLRIVLLYVVI